MFSGSKIERCKKNLKKIVNFILLTIYYHGDSVMSMTYISKTVNLTPRQVEEIAKTRISYSVYIRDLLDEKLRGDQT